MTDTNKVDVAPVQVLKVYWEDDKLMAIPVNASALAALRQELEHEKSMGLLVLDGAAKVEDELRTQLAEWEKLKDPNNLHLNLLRGIPARLTREHLLHLAGLQDICIQLAEAQATIASQQRDAQEWARVNAMVQAENKRLHEKLTECRSSVRSHINEYDRFMMRKEPHANQCDRDEQIRLHDLLAWIDDNVALKGDV